MKYVRASTIVSNPRSDSFLTILNQAIPRHYFVYNPFHPDMACRPFCSKSVLAHMLNSHI